MRTLIFILFLLTAAVSQAQLTASINWLERPGGSSGDTIFYNASRKLTWKDFKGRPDEKSIASAITSSGFGYMAGMRSRNGKGQLVINVYCYFSKDRSWVKPGRESDYALNHEQHHFDVSYIATRLFVNKLRAAKFTMQNYNDLLDKIYAECTNELEKMQNEYDGETRNGQLKDVQADWNKIIENNLNNG